MIKEIYILKGVIVLCLMLLSLHLLSLKKEHLYQIFYLCQTDLIAYFSPCKKGYISRKLLLGGEMWADSVLWETMEDALKAFKTADETACEYMSFMDDESIQVLHLSVERSY